MAYRDTGWQSGSATLLLAGCTANLPLDDHWSALTDWSQEDNTFHSTQPLAGALIHSYAQPLSCAWECCAISDGPGVCLLKTLTW